MMKNIFLFSYFSQTKQTKCEKKTFFHIFFYFSQDKHLNHIGFEEGNKDKTLH